MALDDSPILDEAAKKSEESELKMLEILSSFSGFLCRREIPDKGCDYAVELILNKVNCSAWKFPIQLKSIEKLVLVENGKYISYTFETSRIGYLLKHIPSMGLIVFYSIEERKCFYDYTDKIYERLNIERGSQNWINQKEVNIRIPYENVLDLESAKEIHLCFIQRFERATILQNSQGDKYGLPTVNVTGEFKYDFNNVDHLKQLIKEYGIYFLTNYDLEVPYYALSQISFSDLYSDKDLLFLASLTYSEVGRFEESNVFIKRLKTIYNLDESDMAMIHYVEIKNQLRLGIISATTYLQELELFKSKLLTSQSKIVLEINILRYKLVELRIFEDEFGNLESDVSRVNELIDSSDCSTKIKDLFRLWNCESWSFLLTHKMNFEVTSYKIKKSLGKEMALNEKREMILSFVLQNHKLLEQYNNIYNNAYANHDKLLQATALSASVSHFLNKEIAFLSFGIDEFRKIGQEDILKRNFHSAITAYNYFVELEALKDAHHNLCNAMEILEIAERVFQLNVLNDKNNLLEVKKSFEKELGMSSFDLVIPQLITKLKNDQDDSDDTGIPSLKAMSDLQLAKLAKLALEAFQLPESRLENIINELTGYRLFHQRCNDKNIEVLQLKVNSRNSKNLYNCPTSFILRSKVTGIESPPSSDMNTLLIAWGFKQTQLS